MAAAPLILVPHPTYRVFVDRDRSGIECALSVVRQDGYKVFRRLRARSGQAGHTATEWETGLSPIPFGAHCLLLHPYNRDRRAGQTGVGTFFPICSDPGQPTLIVGPGGRVRIGVGLHEENVWPGSRGCTVILTDTPAREKSWLDLENFLMVESAYNQYLELVVL